MSRALAIATAILKILHYVSAQTPTCLPGYDWAFNSLGESPCNISIALADVCSGLALVQLGPGPGSGYSDIAGNPCTCNTVFYSLFCACAYCQNNAFQNWTDYENPCKSVYIESFPSSIPQSIVIPHYAYLDVVTGDNFNVTAAMSAGGPETTPVPISTIAAPSTSTNPTSVASTTPTSTSFTSTPTSVTSTPTASASVTATSEKSNVGAIVGGVIGGVAIIAAASCLIAFLVLRRYKPLKSTPSTNTAPATVMRGAGLA